MYIQFSHSESFATLITLRVRVSTRGVRVRARDETSVEGRKSSRILVALNANVLAASFSD